MILGAAPAASDWAFALVIVIGLFLVFLAAAWLMNRAIEWELDDDRLTLVRRKRELVDAARKRAAEEQAAREPELVAARERARRALRCYWSRPFGHIFAFEPSAVSPMVGDLVCSVCGKRIEVK